MSSDFSLESGERSMGHHVPPLRRLVFAVPTRFYRDEHGAVRTNYAYARYDAWLPYLEGTKELVLFARIVRGGGAGGQLVEGPRVQVYEQPFYSGPLGFLRTLTQQKRALSRVMNDGDSLYGTRVPNLVGPLMTKRARMLGASMFVQVTGDPEEVLKSGFGGIRQILARGFASLGRRAVAKQVRAADGVIYVTESALQRKYPASVAAVTAVRSNVEISDEHLSSPARNYAMVDASSVRRFHLVTVGSQANKLKGHDVLLRALQILKDRGHDLEATIVGGGRHHEELLELSTELGLDARVKFTGALAGAHLVRNEVAGADLFVMPSLSEGLPRALIEAMSGGVACIGTTAGGIPELLDEDSLCPPGSPSALAELIERVLQEPDGLARRGREQRARAARIKKDLTGVHILPEFFTELQKRAAR